MLRGGLQLTRGDQLCQWVSIGAGATGNFVQGNYIGTGVNGAADLGNASHGVFSFGPNNTIGGASAGAGNVISGNEAHGVSFSGSLANGNQVQGNYIGTNSAGTAPVGNTLDGVRITGCNSNTIGGTAAGMGNTIAFNGGDGTFISTGTGNAIRANSIYSNGDLGIDLAPNGVTPNDTGDSDAVANNLQNFPVVTSANTNGTQVNIQGTLNSTADSTFDLDFYANSSCDGSGNGEGQTYIGSTSVMTNGSGDATFNVTFNVSVSTSQRVTATATDASGNTSEFSSCGVPTVIELASFSATAYDGGVSIEWETGFESDNLGFNIYREESGARTLVNQQLVAGSALVAGSTLRAGQAYAWWDKTQNKAAAYWLEDIDLGGQSTWHGPFFATEVGGHPPDKSRAALLSEVANNEAYVRSSRAIERTAPISRPSSEDLAFQASLGSRVAVKIYVKQEGWYRVSQKELVAAGLDPSVEPRLFRLFAEGKEQPIIVSTGKGELFDESSSIEFYGIGLDTSATDARVYWLVADKQDGLRVQQVKGEGSPSSSRSFTQTIERKDRTIYFAALRNGERENFFGSVVSSGGVDQKLALPHLDQASDQQASIEVALQGVTMLPHRVAVHLNGSLIGEAAFDGQRQGVARLRVPHSLLKEGSNTIRLIAGSGPSDVSLVDSIRVSYQ